MKYIRKESGNLSQQKFSKLVDIPVYKIRDIELGKIKISVEIASVLEEKLSYNFKWILTGNGEPVLEGKALEPDLQLIGDIIESLEKILQEEGTNLPPAKKRRLIELLYKRFIQTGEKADEGVMREHLRLIAA